MKKIDLIGRRFGRLWVKEEAGRLYNSCAWKCICDCGVEKTIRSSHLLAGSVQSCGCFNRDSIRARFFPMRRASALKSVIHQYVMQSKGRKLEWKISIELAFRLFDGVCFYCGTEPAQSMRKWPEVKYNGIDRFDNSIGYTAENVVSCCGKCNRMKNKHSYGDFMNHIRKIIDNRFAIRAL